jgi:hypothetical protein
MGMKLNEEWRNDPERRRAAERLHEHRGMMLKSIVTELEAAHRMAVGMKERSLIVPTLEHEINLLLIRARERLGWHTRLFATEVYIGNMAAFGEGLFGE